MVKGLYVNMKNRWIVAIALLSLICLVVNVLIFYPGYMSSDSLAMFYAAHGSTPSDIAPVLLGLVWRFLYNITGKTSSILIFQLSMLWAALGLLSVYVYKQTGSKLYSLLCLAVGWLPFVVNISGVIWRDNHMTFAMMLSVSLLLFLNDVKIKAWRMVIFVTIILLLIYAALSRYNAIIAVLPMVYLAIRASGYVKRLRWQIVATALFVPLIVFLLFPLVNYSMSAVKYDNKPWITLDDITKVSSVKNIEEISMSADLRASLLIIKKCATEKHILVNNIYDCADNDNRRVLTKNHEQFQHIWTQVIAKNPVGYAIYKAKVFILFLAPQSDYSYIWQDGIAENYYKTTIEFEKLREVNYTYVHRFGYRYFRATFEPLFWLAASSMLLILSRKKRQHSTIVRVLCLSSILYILAYIPTGATSDFRYIYWPVLSTVIAFILYRIDRYNDRNGIINSGRKKIGAAPAKIGKLRRPGHL